MCYQTKKMHVSAYALIALLGFHSDNVLSFSIGWDEYSIKAQQSCTALPPSLRHSCNCSLNTCPHKPCTGPHNCGGKQFERWGCILGTFVPQPEHSTFQQSGQSHSDRSHACGSGCVIYLWGWPTYFTPATGQMYESHKNMAIFYPYNQKKKIRYYNKKCLMK